MNLLNCFQKYFIAVPSRTFQVPVFAIFAEETGVTYIAFHSYCNIDRGRSDHG